jgi:hypothetical protein
LVVEITESRETQSTQEDLKTRVFHWLRDHQKTKKHEKIKKLCYDLGLDYKKNRQTLWQYSSQWITESRFGQGPKSPSLHKVAVYSSVPRCLDRVCFPVVEEQAVLAGWVRSKNRNHELIWENDRVLGRVRWWASGRVVVHIEKPQTIDRRNKLLAVAFGQSGLILSRDILLGFIQSFDLLEQHSVHKTPNGEKLPYMVISDYVKLLGVRIKLGDLSHRDAVEIELVKPKWIEKQQLTLDHMVRVLESNSMIIETDGKAFQEFNKLIAVLAAPRPPLKTDRSIV